ncbi:hypothetical protein Sgly_1262 [Syntrophobotulus glycolicus DSM 8271]|uniref:Uncharacterized protein n=1 Tax=Syntrophobotulus glycolicus (strain DSM 8271 / FlGlyR) TaxID=645991 RepID=F0SV76_SYNGF|nr:FeoC-like transcriptional regulator [Syntrophobotulus glycolicus]ADY55576.1 hypothetical protein Sgly_1262 [Syntrophobotulus glycolicus DSM 8271]
MLQDILTAIHKGEVLTLEQLGQRLQLSPAMVEMSLHQLSRMGYLAKEGLQLSGGTCQTPEKGCSGCSGRRASSHRPIYWYVLTERAKRAL